MFANALLTLMFMPFVMCQLDGECNFRWTMDALDNRLVATEAAVSKLKTALITAEQKLDEQNTEIMTLRDSLDKAETVISNLTTPMRDSSLTSNVVFHAKDNIEQPVVNGVIKFATVIENVGDGYRQSTGCFTAPLQGAYWFTAQLCTHGTTHISPSIHVRGTLVSRVYVPPEDTCGSVSAVAVLQQNDEVCLRSGPRQSEGGPIWKHELYTSNYFMGALIN